MPNRRTLVAALAIAATALAAADSASASRIVYSCAPELCVVDPDSKVTQKLTTDGATIAYSRPSISRDGKKVAALRGSAVMVGEYGANLAHPWVYQRDVNDVALSPDGTAAAESHSYVETRYGCPLTGGCLQLVDRSGTAVSGGDPAATTPHRGGAGVGYLGAGALVAAGYAEPDKVHFLCVLDTPGVPDAPCTVRATSPATLFGPEGSPDGRLAVVTSADAVVLYDLTTGALVRELGKGRDGTFSPDGKTVAFAGADGWLYTVPVTGGTPRKLVKGESPAWGQGDGPGPSLAAGTVRQSKRGKIPLKLTCAGNERCTGTVTLKKGKTTLAKRSYRIAAGRRATVNLTPTSRGKRTIARSRRHTVTVELKPKAGSTVKEKLTLRRA